MTRPQDPALHRSGNVPALDPDAVESDLEAEDRPERTGETGHVPPANRPGTDSGPVQDKPDLDDFVERFSAGSEASEQTDTAVEGDDRRRATRFALAIVVFGAVAYLIHRSRRDG